MDLKTSLQSILQGDILDDEETLTKFSQDASIFSVKPRIVIAPKDVEDIKKLIKFVNDNPQEHLSITPRAAGTCMSGGPINDSIILDMTKYFNKIKEVTSDFAIVQPGVYYRDLDAETQKISRYLPCFTSSRDYNTIGGMIGNNSAGEKTLSLGATTNYIESLKVILSDGNEYSLTALTRQELDQKLTLKNFEGDLYRKIDQLIQKNKTVIEAAKPKVTKNSSGYYLWNVFHDDLFDLTKIIVGSQGTLGIVTEAKVRIIPTTPFSELLVIYLKDLTSLGPLINKILEFKPDSLESYDDQTLKIATRYLPEIFSHTGGKNLFKFYLSALPEIWMGLTGHFPKLVILAEFTGQTKKEVVDKLEAARTGLASFKLKMHTSTQDIEVCKFWTIRRQSFGLLKNHSQDMHTAPFIDDIIVPEESLPQFLPELDEIIKPYKSHLIYTIAGHIGNGNFHIIPLMDFENPETFKIIPELSQKVFDLVFRFKGSMAAEHNDGIVRGVFLSKMFGEEVLKLFQQVKTIFDPKDIFNPHKKSDANWDFYNEHFSKPHPDVRHGS